MKPGKIATKFWSYMGICNWQLSGSKRGRHVTVVWGFDTFSGTLVLVFELLPGNSSESCVRRAVVEAFKLSHFTDIAELNLAPGTSAMGLVSDAVAKVDRLLETNEASPIILSTIF